MFGVEGFGRLSFSRDGHCQRFIENLCKFFYVDSLALINQLCLDVANKQVKDSSKIEMTFYTSSSPKHPSVLILLTLLLVTLALAQRRAVIPKVPPSPKVIPKEEGRWHDQGGRQDDGVDVADAYDKGIAAARAARHEAMLENVLKEGRPENTLERAHSGGTQQDEATDDTVFDEELQEAQAKRRAGVSENAVRSMDRPKFNSNRGQRGANQKGEGAHFDIPYDLEVLAAQAKRRAAMLGNVSRSLFSSRRGQREGKQEDEMAKLDVSLDKDISAYQAKRRAAISENATRQQDDGILATENHPHKGYLGRHGKLIVPKEIGVGRVVDSSDESTNRSTPESISRTLGRLTLAWVLLIGIFLATVIYHIFIKKKPIDNRDHVA